MKLLRGFAAFWETFGFRGKSFIALTAAFVSVFLASVFSKNFREFNIETFVLSSIRLLSSALAAVIFLLITAVEYTLTNWFRPAVLVLLCVIVMQLNSLRRSLRDRNR